MHSTMKAQLCATVGLLLINLTCSQTSPSTTACNDVENKLNDLENAISALCESSPVTPSPRAQCSCPITWTSVPLTHIGTTRFGSTGTISYEIPNIVPDDAREVLVWTYTEAGSSGPQGTYSFIRVYTEEGDNDFAKYISLRSYGQDAYSINSDNLWFPMPSNRRLYLNIPNVHTACKIELYVIGHR